MNLKIIVDNLGKQALETLPEKKNKIKINKPLISDLSWIMDLNNLNFFMISGGCYKAYKKLNLTKKIVKAQFNIGPFKKLKISLLNRD